VHIILSFKQKIFHVKIKIKIQKNEYKIELKQGKTKTENAHADFIEDN